MNVLDLTLTQLRNIAYKRPCITDNKIVSFVIVPLTTKHESGYSNMKFVLLDKFNNIIGCVGGYSDVVYLNNDTPKISWNIDCLPKSRCLRIWCHKELTLPDLILSSFEIHTKEGKA